MVVSMSKPSRAGGCRLVVGLAVIVGSSGCEPPTIVEATPGADQRAVIRQKKAEKDNPEALGEMGGGGGAKTTQTQHVVPNIPPAVPTAKGETKTTESGVKYTTLKEGDGATAKVGQRVSVHYVGKLDDGREFDSSRKRGQPFEFLIGAESVIKGWDEGVPGMKIGELRKLDVPASAAYGALGKGDVPANADLHFEVELMDVK